MTSCTFANPGIVSEIQTNPLVGALLPYNLALPLRKCFVVDHDILVVVGAGIVANEHVSPLLTV